MYESSVARRAYIEGARAAYDSALPRLEPTLAREVEYWIEVELADWTRGNPPPPPAEWVEA